MRDDARPMLRPPPSLPVPAHEALQASRALVARIEAAIAANAGWLSFADYMQLALYSPGLGYYSGVAAKFGRDGDFVTAPLLGPLFARTLTLQIAELFGDPAIPPSLLEFGAGNGELAGGLLAELGRLGITVERYSILEPSADLAQRQRETISQLAPGSLERVEWLQRLPEAFRGVMIANEVVDAMPVHLVGWRDEGIVERGVALQDGRLVWAERPAADEVLETAQRLAIAAGIRPPYMSELALAARGWVRSVSECLAQGVLLVIDYGFAANEYYHPQRASGTLMCHYRHHAHADPFFYPGLQDITAHVDFSALASAARDAGLDLLGYATQANFLINCGITGVLSQTDPAHTANYLPLAASAQTLLSPAEMGELFKVIALGRGVSGPLAGFARSDRANTLLARSDRANSLVACSDGANTL